MSDEITELDAGRSHHLAMDIANEAAKDIVPPMKWKRYNKAIMSRIEGFSMPCGGRRCTPHEEKGSTVKPS